MLVLLSFGLVLLATILLVVGLLNDDGINLIYLSIASSATAAVVLFIAFRRARPADEGVATGGPAPLGDDLDAIVHDDGAGTMADTPAAPPTAPAAAPPPAAPTEPEPVSATADDSWVDDTDWEVDDLEFPIADYDDLSVAEIMPLLPQLYSDELDIVYEREQSTKNRSTILARLEKLKETGTDADAEELAVAGTGDSGESDADALADVTRAEPPAPATGPSPRAVSLLDDDEDDDAAFFPIADYDDLSVSQIVPLLPQLEMDELEDVKAREQAGANRAALIAEIDRHLSGELEPSAWSGAEETAPEPEPEAVVAEPSPQEERDRLPIYGYDNMTVAEIRPRLGELSAPELEQLLRYEEARDNRKTIVAEINRRLDGAGAEEPAPAKRSARKPAPARKTAAKKAAKSARKATKATKATKKRAASRFPIANYDELTVADIRPRLTKLSPAQLEQVRERELTGAGRKTILNDIDNRLS